MPNSDEMQDMTDFLKEVEEDLFWAVSADQEGRILLGEEAHRLALEAWGQIAELLGAGQVQLAGGSPEFTTRLDELGFTGPLYSFKREGHRTSRGIFRSLLASLRSAGISIFHIARNLRGPFQRLLGWINVLLGSLAKAIVQLDPVKEYKEALEKSIQS